MKTWKIGALGALTAAAAFVAPSASLAGGQVGEYCQQQGQDGGPGGQYNPDLCATGPAGCVAIGLYARVEPSVALPGGATAQLSRSASNAAGWNGFGQGHGDTAVAKADVPPALGEGLVESRCDSFSYGFFDERTGTWFGHNFAEGAAETERLHLDLNGYSIPVNLDVDVLREDGWSANGAGGNSANIVGVNGSVLGNPVNLNGTVPPNTVVPLGLATLYLNEQMVGFGYCPVYWGDALRLVVTDPTTGGTLATVIVSWVSTSTCPM